MYRLFSVNTNDLSFQPMSVASGKQIMIVAVARSHTHVDRSYELDCGSRYDLKLLPTPSDLSTTS